MLRTTFTDHHQEAADGIIELKEDNVRAVEAMLHFMYTFDYDGSGNDQERISPMLFNTEVYSIGEKYAISALKQRAKEKFDKVVRICWDMDDFAPAVTKIYNSTPSTDKGLRGTVVKVAHEHVSALLLKNDFRVVLEETAGFAADVTRLLVRGDNPSLVNYRCPNCFNVWRAVLSSTSAYYCIYCGFKSSDWASCAVK